MNKFLSILLMLCTLASLDVKAQSDDHNYIAKSSMQDEQGKNSVVTVEYYDGLGRKEQVVTNGVKPGYPTKTLLSRTIYDDRGNEWKKSCQYLLQDWIIRPISLTSMMTQRYCPP